MTFSWVLGQSEGPQISNFFSLKPQARYLQEIMLNTFGQKLIAFVSINAEQSLNFGLNRSSRQ